MYKSIYKVLAIEYISMLLYMYINYTECKVLHLSFIFLQTYTKRYVYYDHNHRLIPRMPKASV